MLIANCHDFFSFGFRTEFDAGHITGILSAGLDLPSLSTVVCGGDIVYVISLFGIISTNCDSEVFVVEIYGINAL
ncbi:hypothetical protein D3C86_1796190 [compost metagenome]